MMTTTLSEINVLYLIKYFSEALQNLPYFWNSKTHVIASLFFISRRPGPGHSLRGKENDWYFFIP